MSVAPCYDTNWSASRLARICLGWRPRVLQRVSEGRLELSPGPCHVVRKCPLNRDQSGQLGAQPPLLMTAFASVRNSP
jgi:hypothetical protein